MDKFTFIKIENIYLVKTYHEKYPIVNLCGHIPSKTDFSK